MHSPMTKVVIIPTLGGTENSRSWIFWYTSSLQRLQADHRAPPKPLVARIGAESYEAQKPSRAFSRVHYPCAIAKEKARFGAILAIKIGLDERGVNAICCVAEARIRFYLMRPRPE